MRMTRQHSLDVTSVLRHAAHPWPQDKEATGTNRQGRVWILELDLTGDDFAVPE